MRNENDGGPAFPQNCLNEYGMGPSIRGDRYTVEGMSLRDYFAGQALAGEFAAQNEHCGAIHISVSENTLFERAQLFYRMADAMLEAREASNA